MAHLGPSIPGGQQPQGEWLSSKPISMSLFPCVQLSESEIVSERAGKARLDGSLKCYAMVGAWEEWQLRILVLTSLFMQYVLFCSLWMRRAPILRRLRVLVWIAYIGSDAVAIYALATLFNRRKQTSDGESSALEVLWAPVLLIHLGGQPFISAYSLEDNELWKRHTITLVSQVMVAFYVFCKWWSGEKILLAAAILLFILGILKFAQKPWALRTASFNSLQATSVVFLRPEAQRGESIRTLEEYVQAAKQCVLEIKVDSQHNELIPNGDFVFVDLSAPYSFRMAQLRSFLKLEDMRAYNALQDGIGCTFDALYTRIGSVITDLGMVLVFLFPFLAIASMVLFATSHKDAHNEKDITVTYILFSCTALQEFLFPCIATFTSTPCGWHNLVSQYNLISFCVRRKKPTILMKLATFNFPREFINQHWYIQHVYVAFQVTGVVCQHLKRGWKKNICNAASYRRFNELRGQRALRRYHHLGWSLNMPFDKSVLTWHIATDLCFYHPNTPPQCREGEGTQRSREISNYLVYLLIIRPEMLMPGTRSNLFTSASDKIVGNSEGPFDTEEMIAQEILNMPMVPVDTSMVSNAFKLAKALMELSNKERSTVIQGAWVEMLCYSASRCRGYLHAKCLGEGGEFLTTICILLSVMGMETLADRHQWSELPQEEEGEEQDGDGEEEEEAYTFRAQGSASQSADDYNPV